MLYGRDHKFFALCGPDRGVFAGRAEYNERLDAPGDLHVHMAAKRLVIDPLSIRGKWRNEGRSGAGKKKIAHACAMV